MTRPKICGVYAIRNRVNGKVYVGSSLDILARWANHRSDLNAGDHYNFKLQAAWKKYSSSAFEFTVLEEAAKTQLIEAEQRWIDKLNAARSEHGYNLSEQAYPIVITAEGIEKNRVAIRGERNYQAKLTDNDVREIKQRLVNGERVGTLAKEYGVVQSGISAIKSNHSWKHIPWPDETRLKAQNVGEGQHLAVLTDEEVARIKELLAEGVKPYDIAVRFSVDSAVICHILHGRSWKHVPWPASTHPPRQKLGVKFTEQTIREAKQALTQGEGVKTIAHRFGLSISMVYNLMNESAWAEVPWPSGERPDFKRMARASAEKGVKLTEVQVREIIELLKQGRSKAGLAREYGVSDALICAINSGRSWKTVSRV